MQVIWTNRNGGVSRKVGGVSQAEVDRLLAEKVKDIEAAHDEEIEDLNTAHAAEIIQLNNTHTVEITEINAAHAEEVAGLNTTIDEKDVEIDKLEAEIAELEEFASTFPPNVEEVAY